MNVNNSVDETPIGLISEEQFTAIACYLSICGLFGLVVNAATLMVLLSVATLRCPTNIFVMAVLVCDILMSIVGIPFEAVSSAYNRWIFGDTGCSIHGFTMAFLGYTSIYLLTAVSVERCLLITNPFSRPMITNTRAIGITLVSAAVSLLLAMLPLLGWGSYQLEGVLISCSINWQSNHPLDVSYIVTVFILCLVLPVGVMVYSYCQVFLTVRSLARNQIWGKKSRVTKRNLKIEYRTTRNILILIGAFILCWTPYATVSLWAASSDPGDIPPLSGTIPSLIAKSSVMWNPVIYVFTNKQFRIRVSSILPCCVYNDNNDNDTEAVEDKQENLQLKLLKMNGRESVQSQDYNSMEAVSDTNNGKMSPLAEGEGCCNAVILLSMDETGEISDL